MTLVPLQVAAEAAPNHELADLTQRFWIGPRAGVSGIRLLEDKNRIVMFVGHIGKGIGAVRITDRRGAATLGHDRANPLWGSTPSNCARAGLIMATRVLTINTGSSSLKAALYHLDTVERVDLTTTAPRDRPSERPATHRRRYGRDAAR